MLFTTSTVTTSRLVLYKISPILYCKNSQSRLGLSSVLHPRQHSTGYMGDGFYRSKDPTNSIKVLKVHIVHREIKHTIIKQ